MNETKIKQFIFKEKINFLQQHNWQLKIINKYILLLICLFLINFSIFAENKNTFNPVKLANKGKAEYVIAVAKDLNEFEQKALDDLKKYLELVTGAKFAVLPEAQVGDRSAIYLGQSKYAKTNGIDFSSLGKEEWLIKTTGNGLIITGGRPIGTFYGVWALLEKIGVWALSMEETVIPSYPSLTLSDVDERKKPYFAGRVIYDKFPIQGAPNRNTRKREKSLRYVAVAFTY